MTDPRIEKLAELLVNYSVAVRSGDRVCIEGDASAEPLLKAVYVRVLHAGGHPIMEISLPGMEELFYRHASEEQLQHIPEPRQMIMEKYDVRIVIEATENTKSLSGVDPARIVLRQRARAGLMNTFMRRSASGEMRWTLAIFPTNSYAQDAEMSLTDYEDFVYGACLPDMNDPVGYWQAFSQKQQKIVDRLKGKKQAHVIGPETDLRLSIDGRVFVNCDGHANMPDGELYTGPVEDSVDGHVLFSYPAIYAGHEVTGVRLWFERGRVVKATAEKNEEFLLRTLDTDAGSRRVGEFAIGTNESITRFTRQILFDEKTGGSFHLALGAGYPETGSKNESAIHWDMICDRRQGGEIRINDKPFYRDGRFVVEP
ncbi:MAG: aminopeptidase [Chloroflexi bacterium]|nr:aminopeptidase [Chloroflexota bacterium]